jgi:DNA repair exonuclease SbcCD ATPase subunit
MASESTDSRSVALDLPATLDEWLTERAADMGVEREELLVQLLSSYQVATESENGEAVTAFETALEDGAVDIERLVEEAVGEAVPEEGVAEQVDRRIDGRLDSLEAEIEDKLDDIRRRVVQVKQEADSKAPADHDHEAFDRLDDLEREVSGLRDQVAELEAAVGETDTPDGDIEEELADVQSKLTQLARIVVELRDEGTGGDTEAETALSRIKTTAAREGFEQADCGACGEPVSLALLTEPTCPHCQSRVRNVVPGSGGMFGSNPRLTGPNTSTADEQADGTGVQAAAGVEASDDE